MSGAAAAAMGMGGGEATTAKKMLGPVMWVDAGTFVMIVSKGSTPIVCHMGPGKLSLSKNHVYLTSYKGFIFRTEVNEPLRLPPCEFIEVKQIQ
jgi:hypothetical protein